MKTNAIDPIQAAIEKAEAAVEALMLSGPIAGVPQATENRLAIVRAAIRSLAALVSGYGHAPNCGCHAKPRTYLEPGPETLGPEEYVKAACVKHSHPYRDSYCLPESREEPGK